MIEDIVALFGSFQHEQDAFFYLFLADEFGEGRRPEGDIEGCVRCVGGLLVKVLGHSLLFWVLVLHSGFCEALCHFVFHELLGDFGEVTAHDSIEVM